MEHRFSFKDFVLVVLLLVIIVSIWLSMKQRDRQHDVLQTLRLQMREQISSQSRLEQSIRELNRKIDSGIQLAQHAGAPSQDEAMLNPFYRIAIAQDQVDYARGDWLVEAFGSSVASITPFLTRDIYGRTVQNYILEPLVTRDPETLEFIPLIAKSWKIVDQQEQWQAYVDARMEVPLEEDEIRLEKDFPKGGTETEQTQYIARRLEEGRRYADVAREEDCPAAARIYFELRNDVVFSDGEPLTAADVVFTWELLNNPELNAPEVRNFYDNIQSYTALNDYEVVFEAREPNYLAFGMAGGMTVLPKHFYEQYTIAEINRSPGLIMGTGAYRMEDPTNWSPGKPLELHRNDRYWGLQPAFDQIRWRIIENDVARMTAYRNREIDRISATPEQYENLLADERVASRSRHFAYDTLPTGYRFIAWNQQRGGNPTPFADKRVRQAMTLLIERERIAEEIMLGYARVANGPFPHGSPQADPNIKAREYNLEKAKELLAEAGWKDRKGDGVLRNEQGTAFRFQLTYPSGSDLYDRMVLYMRDSFARAGINMQLDPLEWSVFSERINDRAFDALSMGWGGGAIESDIRQMFHSNQVNADNFTHYINKELDVIIDQARRELDDDKRMELWQQAHRILYEDQPYSFLFTQQATVFIDDRIHNVQRVTTGLNSPEEWYVPLDKQKWTQ